MKTIDAIILAGGFGTRLNSISKGIPKPLMPIGKKRFLEYPLRWLEKHGIRKVILSLHYKPENFLEYVQSLALNCQLDTVIEPRPLGTGGAIKYVIKQKHISKNFIILNADTFLSFDLNKMLRSFLDLKVKAMIGLTRVKDSKRYGRVRSKGQLALEFLEKGKSGPAWINNGCTIMNQSALKTMPECFSIEKTLYSELIRTKQLGVYKSRGSFYDIGIPSDYNSFKKFAVKLRR